MHVGRFISKPRQQPLTEASPGSRSHECMQALTTQINLAQRAPAQLVVFIEKQAGACMTPSPSEEGSWSQKGHVPCVIVPFQHKVKAFY